LGKSDRVDAKMLAEFAVVLGQHTQHALCESAAWWAAAIHGALGGAPATIERHAHCRAQSHHRGFDSLKDFVAIATGEV
jgi:hypothetical protein